MGCDVVLIAGAATDNTVLWTSADAHQNLYKVVVVEDCTMVHREREPPGAKEAALSFIEGSNHHTAAVPFVMTDMSRLVTKRAKADSCARHFDLSLGLFPYGRSLA